MRFARHILLTSALLLGSPLLAQTDKQTPQPESAVPPVTYKLNFTIRQLVAGKLAESRSYSAVLGTDKSDWSQIRSGDKVPNFSSDTQFTYYDTGVNIDFREVQPMPGLRPNQVALRIKTDISTLVEGGRKTGSNPPLIRQDRWESSLIIDLGKPTLLSSSDDPTLDRTTQVELLVAKAP